MQNLFNERQAASFLCSRPATLRQWQSRDYGPSYHRLGGAIRYHKLFCQNVEFSQFCGFFSMLMT